MTELLAFPEIELSDAELEILEAAGGCQGTTLGLAGLHLGFGHLRFGGFYGGGFGYGGFYGGPVLVAQPQVALVPVQTSAVVAQPVTQTVAATTCGVQTVATC